MASTETAAEEFVSSLMKTLVIFALPMFFIFLYTLTFDWAKSDIPLYSNQFGAGSDRANQVALLLGPKFDFYLQILLEHSFSTIMAAALCSPFVKTFYSRYGFFVTLFYSMAGSFVLFLTNWPITHIFRYLNSDLSFQLVFCGMLLLPQMVYGIYIWLTNY